MQPWETWFPLRGRWLRYACAGLGSGALVVLVVLSWTDALLPGKPGYPLGLVLSAAFGVGMAGFVLMTEYGAQPGLSRTAGAAAAICCLASILSIVWSANLGLSCVSIRHSECGTCKSGFLMVLMGTASVALLVPVGTGWFARGAKLAGAVARCSALSAVAAWTSAVLWWYALP